MELSALLHPSLALFAWGAWMAGRAVALTWRSPWTLASYVLLLAATARFLGFALFGQPLLHGAGYAVAALVLGLAAAAAYRLTRARQMTSRYRWLYEARGPFSWHRRRNAAAEG